MGKDGYTTHEALSSLDKAHGYRVSKNAVADLLPYTPVSAATRASPKAPATPLAMPPTPLATPPTPFAMRPSISSHAQVSDQRQDVALSAQHQTVKVLIVANCIEALCKLAGNSYTGMHVEHLPAIGLPATIPAHKGGTQ